MTLSDADRQFRLGVGLHTAIFLMSLASEIRASNDADPHQVSSLEITILSTMLTEAGVGEWGFAAIIEADGHRILFDTGLRPDTVLTNAEIRGVDLTDVEEVVLSHNHGDHTGGLISLRRELSKHSPDALANAHVGRGIFWKRIGGRVRPTTMTARRVEFEALGGAFIEHDSATEIHPGIWLTGPVPRVHAEKNWGNPFRQGGTTRQVQSPDGLVEDNIPESMSMVINTAKGLVVISGCGHAGIINTLEYAQQVVRPVSIHAAIGGFHLVHGSDEVLAWTAKKLVNLDVENLIGAHCTGLEPVYRFRDLVQLARKNAVVGAVGASFSLSDGIDPLALAH